MNKITILAAVTSLSMVALPLYADDTHHPEKTQKTTDTKAAAPAAAKPAGAEPAADQQIKRAQETMRKLQDQMGNIRQTSDPKERHKLMHEHMQTMQEGMKQLRGMGSMEMHASAQAKMMYMAGDGKQGGMMMGNDMMKMHDMMEMRMEMMETMMEQMMQREEMQGTMPEK
jgi:phytoene dehydrogenase-like protein